MSKLLSAILALSLMFSAGGCLFPVDKFIPTPTPSPSPNVDVTVEINEAGAEAIKASLAGVPKEDVVLLYIQCKGIASYVKHDADGITSTPQLVGLLAKVQEDYGWVKNKYSAFNDETERQLKAAGFEEPKKLDEVKLEVVKLFETFAEGCRRAGS